MQRRKFIKQSGILGAVGLTMASLPACTNKLDTEFLILGGGISGLTLAYELEKTGKEYTLYEGSPRLGGRLFTHKELQNREVGGRGIGDRYDVLMSIVKDLDIPLIDITDYMRSPTSIFYKNQLYKDWPEGSANPRMLEYILPKKGASLAALNEWYQVPDLDITYGDHLKALGRTEEELDIINISANYNDVRETSAVNSLHSAAFRKFNGSKRIYNFDGGSIRLIEALRRQLNDQVYTNKMVTKITDHKTHVSVETEDGKTIKARKVISTLPFSTLRKVDLDCSASANQKKAIDKLGYTKITQIHIKPTTKYWETDGYHIDMWTDTPLERVMNSSAYPNQQELVCWVNGKGTAFFDKMSDAEIAAYTLNELKRIRPSTEGNLEYVGTHNWGTYKYNLGAYAEFKVGQSALFEDMIRPAGNIHFAGEHTAKESRGIEGAAASALRVFKELV